MIQLNLKNIKLFLSPFYSIYFFLLETIFTLYSILLTFLIYPVWGKDGIHFLLCFFSKGILKLAGIKVKILNKSFLPSSGNFLIVANHQSMIDIFVLNSLLYNKKYKWLMKDSLLYIPGFGLLCKMAGYIFINRRNRFSAYKSIQKSISAIKNGYSLIIFPEGTRSIDGKIHKFKSGSLIIFKRTNVDILPVVIRGTFEIKPKTRITVIPGTVKIKILRPVKTMDINLLEKSIKREFENLL